MLLNFIVCNCRYLSLVKWINIEFSLVFVIAFFIKINTTIFVSLCYTFTWYFQVVLKNQHTTHPDKSSRKKRKCSEVWGWYKCLVCIKLIYLSRSVGQQEKSFWLKNHYYKKLFSQHLHAARVFVTIYLGVERFLLLIDYFW